MARQKSKKKEKKASENVKESEQNDQGKNPFGTGILPERDLKKNLGCG